MADIRLEGLRKEFDDGAVVAVRDLNLTFREGTTTCLLGPSGCGKTTLMRIIAGLEEPSAGRVFFGDEDVTDLKTRDRNLGMVFQYPVVYRGITVRQNLALPLRADPLSDEEKKQRVNELLEMIDLVHVADTDVDKLDGGTRQKVAVARAVSRHAPIILFDEPITNVDPDLKLQLKRTLRELFSRLNQTIIYVTHDQTEAMTLADEIALMQDGAIEQMAPPRDLYNKSESVFGGWFLGNPGMNFVPVAGNEANAASIAGGALVEAVTTIGFRPEDVLIGRADDPTGMEAVVEHIAVATGGQKLVNLRSGDLRLKAKLPWDAGGGINDGDAVRWAVPTERIRKFNADDVSVSVAAAAAAESNE
ncbi:MAG: ABC transporter ATP-binding protein [bacterium]|nr:ABC transporter ATP-binding protein [bacterium]